MATISPKFLDPYINGANRRHKYYADSVKQAEEHEWHFDGEYPEELIGRRRPAESVIIQQYRKETDQAIEKSDCMKVLTTLQKIEKAPDYVILPPKKEDITKSGAKTDEDIYTYLFKKMPKWRSLSKWIFQYCLRRYVTQANAMIMVMPLNWDKPDNEYYNPYPFIFCSDDVIDYKENEYYVLKSEEEIRYTEGDRTYDDGWVYYVANTTNIARYEQTSFTGDYKQAWDRPHNLGIVPVFSMPGTVIEENGSQTYKETPVIGMIPHLNLARSINSDLLAEMVQHVHSTMWMVAAQECKLCKGTGTIPKEDGTALTCKVCNGKGTFPFNSFEHIVVQQSTFDNPNQPTPPAGYLIKPIDAYNALVTAVRDYRNDALSAIYFNFLQTAPSDQSAVAKQEDKQEPNNFVYQIASALTQITEQVIYLCNEWRFIESVPNKETRDKMLPIPLTPTRFDLFSDQYYLDELSKLNTAKVDPSIRVSAQIDYVSKRYNANPVVLMNLLSKIELDPFPGYTQDEVNGLIQMGFATTLDGVIHANIDQFVNDAMLKNPTWKVMDLDKRKAIINQMANEKLTLIAADTKKMIDPAIPA